MKHVTRVGVAALLAFSAACSNSSNPVSPTGSAAPGAVSAVPEGSPTLKANTPGSPQPSPGTTLEFGPSNSLSTTLSVSNATATHAASVALAHRFQLYEGDALIAEPIVPAGSGRTSWPVSNELKPNTVYRWRARAELAEAYGGWSAFWEFRTPALPVSGARRTPDPPPGQRLPLPFRAGVVNAAFSARPDLVRRSCQEHGGTWEFMDYLVDKLREEDNRWGYNGKRGNANDPSQDIVAYHWGAGPSNGSTQVYIMDIMLSHCGSPSPAWIDQTGVTAQQGAIGRWTGRGRFTN